MCEWAIQLLILHFDMVKKETFYFSVWKLHLHTAHIYNVKALL